MRFPNNETVRDLKRQFPTGCRVCLDHMDDPKKEMHSGMLGTVQSVDDAGTIHVKWDEGFRLGVCYGIDQCHRVTEDG